MNKKNTKRNLNKKCTSYALLGVLATFVLLLSTSPTLASGTLLINTNPSGATVSLSYTGQVLGTTPYSMNLGAYPSPTFLTLTKSGYQPINNIPIYNWMTSLPTYDLKPLSTTTTTALVAAPATATASTPAPTAATGLSETPASTTAPAPAGFTTNCDGGLLKVNSNPDGAKVYTDTDNYLATTPFCINMKIQGSTNIKFIKPGYNTAYTRLYYWMMPPDPYRITLQLWPS